MATIGRIASEQKLSSVDRDRCDDLLAIADIGELSSEEKEVFNNMPLLERNRKGEETFILYHFALPKKKTGEKDFDALINSDGLQITIPREEADKIIKESSDGSVNDSRNYFDFYRQRLNAKDPFYASADRHETDVQTMDRARTPVAMLREKIEE